MSDTSSGRTAEGTATKSNARQRTRRLLLEVGVAGLGYAVFSRCQTANLLPGGETAPDFTTHQLDGSELRLDQLPAVPLLLHFWATWCGVCRQEFDALNALQRELTGPNKNRTGQPRPLLLTLAADEDREAVIACAKDNRLTYPIALATPALLALYRVKAFPTSYYLNSDRRVSASTVGMSTRWAMSRRLSCAAD